MVVMFFSGRRCDIPKHLCGSENVSRPLARRRQWTKFQFWVNSPFKRSGLSLALIRGRGFQGYGSMPGKTVHVSSCYLQQKKEKKRKIVTLFNLLILFYSVSSNSPPGWDSSYCKSRPHSKLFMLHSLDICVRGSCEWKILEGGRNNQVRK